MPPSIAFLTRRLASRDVVRSRDSLRLVPLALLHGTALALLLWSEVAFAPKVIFVLTWGVLNFFWLALLRRPAVSAALSLVMVVVLILASRLKYDIIWMTANFLDVMIVNTDTVKFLLAVRPDLFPKALLALALMVPVLMLLWWIDTARVPLRTALLGFFACLAALVGTALAVPQEEWETFAGDSYVSKFSHSGVAAIFDLMTRGYMESDATVTDHLKALTDATCTPKGKPPHIILVHDEFELRYPGGARHQGPERLRQPLPRPSMAGARHFIAEGAGGPSWYTEYNVLAGLSARSFGRFAFYVTQIAAGRVERGLPHGAAPLRLPDVLPSIRRSAPS